MDCVFCKIVNKEIPKDFSYEDENVVAFDDIKPQAKVHILFVPKKHIIAFENIQGGDDAILSSIRQGIQKIASDKGLIGKGYRIQVYAGGAQTVDHLHFHLLGPTGLKV